MKEDKVTKGRKILYVDASFNTSNNEAKISLYDKERNKLDTLLLEDISSSAEAEKYAIVYACIYTKKKNIVNRKVHILNDNHNATLDENILKVCKYFNVNVSWIPREINEIADKGSKLEVNIRESESNYLKLFYDILMKNSFVEEKKPLV